MSRVKVNLNGKNIILTGGVGLLGKQFAHTLVDAGANVIIFDIRPLPKELKDKCKYYWVDVTDISQVYSITKKIHSEAGVIDILINCAAYNPVPYIIGAAYNPVPNIIECSDLEPVYIWKDILDINLTGVYICCKVVSRFMNRGTIINIASDLGMIAPKQDLYSNWIKPASYGVGKAGVINLTKWLATFYKDKIKVVCLVLGGVKTANLDSDFVRRVEKEIPLGRMARPDEYNGALLFLCSDDSDYMHGQCLIMDGGRSVW